MSSTNSNIIEDRVVHPSHYTWLKDKCGIEVIDITRHMNFSLGNAIKYILRSGHKSEEGYTDTEKQIEDLEKAKWYIEDEIKSLKGKYPENPPDEILLHANEISALSDLAKDNPNGIFKLSQSTTGLGLVTQASYRIPSDNTEGFNHCVDITNVGNW